MIFSDRFFCGDSRICTLQRHIPVPLFRHSFHIDTIPASFEVTICGLGVYELFVNGKRITKGYLAPYRSNPNHFVYYDHYDITPYLDAGENVVGIALGNGIMSSEMPVWGADKYPWRSAPCFAFAAEADGKFLFDGSVFVTHGSEVTFNDWHCTESIDARLAIKNWNDTGFDDSSWEKVSPACEPSGEKKLCTAEPVKEYDRRKPVKMWQGERGFIFDFGISGAGTYHLKIKGECGQQIEVYTSDCVIEGKKITNRNLYCWSLTDKMADKVQHDHLTLSGKPDEFEPRFTFRGFRFAEITGITQEQAQSLEITFILFSNGFASAGSFRCDNEQINRLQQCVIQSDRSNFIHFPLDCPQREKNGWTGDAALSCEQLLLNFDCANSLFVWLQNICKAQRDDGSLPGIVPTHTWGYDWGSGPAWDNVLFELPWRIYVYTGNDEAIKLCAPHMLKYLCYMSSKSSDSGLYAYGLEDWLPVNVHTPLCVTDTIMCRSIADTAEKCFWAVGMHHEAQYAASLSKKIKKAFRKEILRPHEYDGPLGANDTVATHAMAIYYGMYEEEELPSAIYKLKCRIKQTGGHIDFGALCNRVFWRVVGEHIGMDEALDMMLSETYPSFAALLKNGMTTLWEGFEYFEGDMAHVPAEIPQGFWSFDHHFWGDISAFWYRYLAGIRIDGPGRVEFAPMFSERVKNVCAEHVFAEGTLRVEIDHNGNSAHCRISVPRGISARVNPPRGWASDAAELVCGENEVVFSKLG